MVFRWLCMMFVMCYYVCVYDCYCDDLAFVFYFVWFEYFWWFTYNLCMMFVMLSHVCVYDVCMCVLCLRFRAIVFCCYYCVPVCFLCACVMLYDFVMFVHVIVYDVLSVGLCVCVWVCMSFCTVSCDCLRMLLWCSCAFLMFSMCCMISKDFHKVLNDVLNVFLSLCMIVYVFVLFRSSVLGCYYDVLVWLLGFCKMLMGFV